MPLIPITRDRVAEAAEVLAGVMQDEDEQARFVLPDPDERLAFDRALYQMLIGRALDEGRVDAWNDAADDSIVGVAVWLRRPAIDEVEPVRSSIIPGSRPRDLLTLEAAERAERFATVLRRLRERVRPDRHAYLDTIGVLAEHRRHGIAGRLLEAGHAWADAEGLPCALDTETDANIRFYSRRGYRIVASLAVPGTDLRITGMRRGREPPGSATAARTVRVLDRPPPRTDARAMHGGGTEIERKWLLDAPPSEAWLAEHGARPLRIEQTYLRRVPGAPLGRVRRIDADGGVSHTLTEKRGTSGGLGVREENECELDRAGYERHLADRDPGLGTIRKTRHVCAFEGHTLEIDVFEQPPGLVLLEVELADADERVELPADLPIVREVTEERAYLNVELARLAQPTTPASARPSASPGP